MKRSDADIGAMLKNELQQYTTAVSFDSIWDKHERKNKKYFGVKKTMLIPIIILLAAFTVGFAGYGIIRIIDNIDYSFVDDQQVIGKWESVDFVDKVEYFKPDKRAYNDELYLTELVFIDGGDMLTAFRGENLSNGTPTWTKGLILNKISSTASKYEIKELDGEIYMFLEWKSGDYTIRGMKPKYYVLRKADSQKYTRIEDPRIEESIDYPFINDPKIFGRWLSVDFVEAVNDFDPGVKGWPGDLYLTGFDVSENGGVDAAIISENAPKYILTWTKGMILDKQNKIASKYEIKEIDGETYMFFEWKSGNYLNGRVEPWYFVLKKDQ